MKFPILILDSLDSSFNSKQFSSFFDIEFLEISFKDYKSSLNSTILIKDLNQVLIHSNLQKLILQMEEIKNNQNLIFILHKDCIESLKLQFIEYCKEKSCTIFDYSDKITCIQKNGKISRKIFEIGFNQKIKEIKKSHKLKSTMELSRSENANVAREQLILPHTTVISKEQGLIHYSHDLLDALDDEDDDLDF